MFRLEETTVLEYLVQQSLCDRADRFIRVESRTSKNFNLLIHFPSAADKPDLKSLFIKQESLERRKRRESDLQNEWTIYQLLRNQSELNSLQALVSDALQFDADNGILIYQFLDSYHDLGEFYTREQSFPRAIATALGTTLATLHKATLQRQDYQQWLRFKNPDAIRSEEESPDFCRSLEYITPDVFTRVSVDGLKFYGLYQRHRELGDAIACLENDYQPCCLIHNDLKFNNILLHHDWQKWTATSLPMSAAALQLPDQQGILRFIDWEKWEWGDPALDVGAIVADYLKIWLDSLMLSREIDIETSLRFATVPLDDLQPSLAVFIHAYLAQFPEILNTVPDFMERVLRFTGLALIESIQARLHYREPFSNVEICMLQVAKSLLCNPKAAMTTVFGRTEFNPTEFNPGDWPDPPPQPRQETHNETDKYGASVDVPLPAWVDNYTLDKTLADVVEQISISATTIEHPAYVPLTIEQSTRDRALYQFSFSSIQID